MATNLFDAFTNIADAIRVKNGASELYTPNEMVPAILNIPTGSGVSGTEITATAGTAMAKGDTVYFESQVGEWTDVSSDAGAARISTARNYVITNNGRYIYLSGGDGGSGHYWDLVRYDTTTIPWSITYYSWEDLFPGSGTHSNSIYIAQDGDIGCIVKPRFTQSESVIFNFYDLNTMELLFSHSFTSENCNSIDDVSYSEGLRWGFRLFDDYICFKYYGNNEGVMRINRRTNYLAVRTGGYVYRVDWDTPQTFFYLDNYGYVKYNLFDDNGNISMIKQAKFNSISQSGSARARTAVILFGNKLYCGSSYNGDKMTCVDISQNTWVEEPLSFPDAFAPVLWKYGINHTKDIIAVPGSGVIATFKLDSKTWNVLEYIKTGADYTGAGISDKYVIYVANILYNTGAGTVAHKAYNNLHGSRPLGYAIENMTAGESGKFIVLFN